MKNKAHWLWGLAFMVLCAAPARGAVDLTRMRAIHFTGNWSANIAGIRTAVSGLLDSAPSISASSIQVNVTRGSFVDSSGATITNEIATVHMSGISVGGTTLSQGGFWVGRDATTHSAFIQFRPSLDATLAGIPGFAGDITLSVAADGSTVDTTGLSLATGTAHDFVVAVLAHGADLVQSGQFSLQPGATFDQASVEQLLNAAKATLLAQSSAYWDFLKSENVDWIGISVSIFNEPISDATVRLKYRPSSNADYNVIYTFDDADLRSFISRARQRGFKVYLTLAIAAGSAGVATVPSQSDPTCKTQQYVVSRGFLGSPKVYASDPFEACINPAYWWWDPAHPLYAQNTAQFWSSYTQIAVKYAALCQELGVEMFSLGTETDRLFRSRPSLTWTNDFKKELAQMVAAVRGVYAGLVTYDQLSAAMQHPDAYDGGAGTNFLFSDVGMDVIGVSAYFELASDPVTRVLSVDELKASWSSVFQSYLVPLQSRNGGKPIVFLEFSRQDDVNSPANVSTHLDAPEPGGVTDGMRQQQNAYQAFFDIDDQFSNLAKGAFLWGNGIPDPSDCSQIGFAIRCKPVGQTVASVYGRWKQLDAVAVSYEGLWLKGDESGWGVNVTHQGTTLFATWFTYDTDGTGMWLVASSVAQTSAGNYSGTLYRTVGPAFSANPFNSISFPANYTQVGTLSFSFSDANTGTMSYTVNGVSQTKSITRYIYASGGTNCTLGGAQGAAPNYQDLWLRSAGGTTEAGWGVNITHQGDILFATWFTYLPGSGSTNKGMWLVMSNGNKTAPGVYTGALQTTTGPAFGAQPFNPNSVARTTVGSGTFTFTDANNGTFNYTVNGTTQSKPIARFVYASPATVCQ